MLFIDSFISEFNFKTYTGLDLYVFNNTAVAPFTNMV